MVNMIVYYSVIIHLDSAVHSHTIVATQRLVVPSPSFLRERTASDAGMLKPPLYSPSTFATLAHSHAVYKDILLVGFLHLFQCIDGML